MLSRPILESPLLGVAAAASTHGLTDAMYPPECLWPYGVLLAPLPPLWTTFAFLLASTVHFGYDIGLQKSAMMHAGLLAIARVRGRAASTLGCAYYLGVHVPLHLKRHWTVTPLAKSALAAAIGLFPATHRLRRCRVPLVAQRLVIGHVAVDVLSRRNENGGR